MKLVWFLLINLMAGSVASQLMRGIGFAMLGDIVVGMIGGAVGNVFSRTLDFYAGGGWLDRLIVATVRAIVVLFLGI